MFHAGETTRIAAQVITAGAIARIPVLLVGPPGLGKTECAIIVAAVMTEGNRQQVWKRTFSAGTSPALVQGAVNMQAFTRDGIVTVTTIGTPYDHSIKFVILDELTRASPAVSDGLLNALDGSRFMGTRVTVATSNTPLDRPVDGSYDPGHRRLMEALVSRFGLYMLYGGEAVSNNELLLAKLRDLTARAKPNSYRQQASESLGYDVPSIDELETYRHIYGQIWRTLALAAKEGEIPKIIRDILTTAKANGLDGAFGYRMAGRMLSLGIECSLFERMREMNREAWKEARLTGNWQLYAQSCIRRSADLAETVRTLSPLGLLALRHAWPFRTREEQLQWDKIVMSCARSSTVELKTFISRLYDSAVRFVNSGASSYDDFLNLLAASPDNQSETWAGAMVQRYPDIVHDPDFCVALLYQCVLTSVVSIFHPDGQPDDQQHAIHVAQSVDPRISDGHDLINALAPTKGWPPDVAQLRLISKMFHQIYLEKPYGAFPLGNVVSNTAAEVTRLPAYQTAMRFIESIESMERQSTASASLSRRR